jgi:hypothetical protein
MESRHPPAGSAQVPGRPTLEIPVACDPRVFSREQRAQHLDLSTDALVRWPRSRSELPDGYLFQYEGDEERFVALARWAAAEHQCCPWAAYSVQMGAFAGGRGAIEVRVTATSEGKEFLAAAYRYLEELDGASPPESIMDGQGKITRKTILDRIKAGCGC